MELRMMSVVNQWNKMNVVMTNAMLENVQNKHRLTQGRHPIRHSYLL